VTKVVAVIQARSSSTRLPKKVLKKIGPNGETLLEAVIARALLSERLDCVVLATTTEQDDDEICDLARSFGLGTTRGPTSDVLARFSQAADEHSADLILRLTADDPFKDPKMMDAMIEVALERKLDYLANNLAEHLPEGLDLELFTRKALQLSIYEAVEDWEREHVTQWIRNRGTERGLKLQSYKSQHVWPGVRLTVDYPDDLAIAAEIYSEVEGGILHRAGDLRRYLFSNPQLCEKSLSVAPRNQGLKLSQAKD
jgi:spore coat polysaccharide biosynthesis protein SpsF